MSKIKLSIWSNWSSMKLSCCLCSHGWCVREAKVAGSKGQAELLCSILWLCRHAASGAFLIAVTTCSFVEEGLIRAQSISRAEVYDCGGGKEDKMGPGYTTWRSTLQLPISLSRLYLPKVPEPFKTVSGRRPNDQMLKPLGNISCSNNSPPQTHTHIHAYICIYAHTYIYTVKDT